MLSEKAGLGKLEGVTGLFKKMLEKLNTAMECKILCEPLVDPVILKSGNTINGEVFSKIKKDPFDCTKDCKDKIPNLLAKEIAEIIKNTENELQNLPIALPPSKTPENPLIHLLPPSSLFSISNKENLPPCASMPSLTYPMNKAVDENLYHSSLSLHESYLESLNDVSMSLGTGKMMIQIVNAVHNEDSQ